MDNRILAALSQANGPLDSLSLAQQLLQDHTAVVGVLKSLETDAYVTLAGEEKKRWVLTKDGHQYVDEGTPEYNIFQAIGPEGTNKKDLPQDILKLGQNFCMRNKWITVDKSGVMKRAVESVVDHDRELLKQVHEGQQLDQKVLDNLKRRKTVALEVTKYFLVQKGLAYANERKKKAADLTSDMLASGAWETEQFKDYNFNALGSNIPTGNLHPLLKVRTQFREIFLEMGFEEMPTNDFVESSFWNFDSLFQPQQHPARDAHDTFFLSEPEKADIKDQEYLKKVKQTHESGIDGSAGWRVAWSEEESRKNIMRTHTTAVSAKMLYRLAQQKEFKPVKYFSIDRVFRNETLDATHLAEFHQVEGVIADRHLGLGHLKKVIKEFFNKIGITQLWFKPAYNPYTEPSMEIFGYHPLLKKKVEIGNSGIFRPEMLRPMGLPEDVNVIAWGLSLERPTMIQYDIANIRDLIGHKVDVKYVRNNPITIFK